MYTPTFGDSGIPVSVDNRHHVFVTADIPTATTSVLGLVKIDGVTINIAAGVISAVIGGGGGIASPGISVNREILIWDGILGAAILTPSLASISAIGTITAAADVIAFQSGSPTGSYWDNLPAASYNVDSHYGGLILDNNATHFYNGVGGWTEITSGTLYHNLLNNLTYASAGHTGFSPTIHNLVDTTNHPVTGLTTGHYLRATAANAYAFSTIAASSVDHEVLRWDGATGNIIHISSGVLIDDVSNLSVAGDVIAYQTASPSGSFWDDLPAASYNVDSHYGGIILGNSNVKFLNENGTWQLVTGGSGGMVYPVAGIALSTGTAWAASITDASANWNTAYTDRLKWDGGAAGLVAATGRTSLGGTTVGQELFLLTNPSAITFIKINADNTVTARSTANFKTDLSLENVTNESKSTMFTNPTFTGTATAASLIVEDLTDGYVPYQKAADDKISNSPLYTDGTNITTSGSITSYSSMAVSQVGATYYCVRSNGANIYNPAGYFIYDDVSPKWFIGFPYDSTSWAQSNDKLIIGRDGNELSNSKVIVLSTGNVGINISPVEKLHLYHNVSTEHCYLKIENGQANGQSAINYVTGSGNWITYIPASLTSFKFYCGGDKITFTNAGTINAVGDIVAYV